MQIDVRDRLHALMVHLPAIHPPKAEQRPFQRLTADEDIAGDAHCRNHGIVLVDRLEPEFHRLSRVPYSNLTPLDPYGSSVRLVHARKDLDQGGFVLAVVADKAHRLAARNRGADVLEGMHARVPFLEALALDDGR